MRVGGWPGWVVLVAALVLAHCDGGEDTSVWDTGCDCDAEDESELIVDGCGEAWGHHTICIESTEKDWRSLHEDPYDDDAIRVRLWFNDRRPAQADLKIHGGLSRTFKKKSYRLTLRESVPPFAVFGAEEVQRRFVLQASWVDPSFLRNWLTFTLLREAGGMAPRVDFAQVYVNGSYHGLYLLIERVDALFLERQGLETAAVLYKAENHNANWRDKADPLAGFDVQEGPDDGHDDLGELLRRLTRTPRTEEAFAREIAPWLCLDDFMRWQRVHSFAQDYDSFTKNYYLYHDRVAVAGQAAFAFRIISWDADATWGNYWDGTPVPADGSPWEGGDGWYGGKPWYGTDGFSPRLFGVPSYWERYRADYLAALATVWQPAVLQARVAAMAEEIAEAAERDLAHWGRDRDFGAEVARLLEAIAVRHQTMVSSLTSAP